MKTNSSLLFSELKINFFLWVLILYLKNKTKISETISMHAKLSTWLHQNNTFL